ncbi:hypothetical protein [Paenibacillus larvae]|uniref:hypothetical protein n=1 Tax=Paenibacillus larvae TaxID=1464 RepID=UPI0005A94CC3|nr:hypothetical protein [Paenibacillus larvae]AVG12985.1 hypothetical protein ERICII_02631 [Paenibacillus larvae subsp. larvae DSM 25430]MDR5569020.1 hypothetical protein [Paenibacillus larvae]MDR5596705.1 hypothetical protein [Paenibacillus larvae]
MEHERELEPFLPTLSELIEMDLHSEFRSWVTEARHVIPKRMMERDPLFHLKNQISEILNEWKSDAEKESEILDKILTYHLKYERR